MLYFIILIILAVLVLLFFIALIPRTSEQQRCGEFLHRDYAHRGLFSVTGKIPENSLPAFERAIRHGVAIELDVHLTKDKEAVVFHDNSLKRMCGTDAKIWDKTLAELKQLTLQETNEQIPLFKEVLAKVDGQVPLLIELKLPTKSTLLCVVVHELLRKYKGPYCIQSFSPFALNWYRGHQPSVLRGQLSDRFSKKAKQPGLLCFMAENLLFNWYGKPDFISYNYRYGKKCLTLKFLRCFYQIPVFGWTIRSSEVYQQYKDQYDALIFDSFIPENTID